MPAIIGNVVIVFDPTMEDVTKNEVFINQPFINHHNTMAQCLLFYTVYQSNTERDQQLDLSGTTADMDTNQSNRRQSQSQNH